MTNATFDAEIRAHSKNPYSGTELVSFVLTYPRPIHSELMTHRTFSRNAASSRAIPTPKQLEMVRKNPAKPAEWGKNQRGMQSKETLPSDTKVKVPAYTGGVVDANGDLIESETDELSVELAWEEAAQTIADFAKGFYEAGIHKQMTNRLIEPFVWMRTIVTTTEIDNWFWLRTDGDADPSIKYLADLMWQAYEKSEPHVMGDNDIHAPFYNQYGVWQPTKTDLFGVKLDENGFTASQALTISSSCCAQISFRKEDDSFAKAQNIYSKLIESEPVHASPFEHQAWVTPYSKGIGLKTYSVNFLTWVMDALHEPGITHISEAQNQYSFRTFDVWSGNFRNFIQHRQVIPNHTCWNYRPQTV